MQSRYIVILQTSSVCLNLSIYYVHILRMTQMYVSYIYANYPGRNFIARRLLLMLSSRPFRQCHRHRRCNHQFRLSLSPSSLSLSLFEQHMFLWESRRCNTILIRWLLPFQRLYSLMGTHHAVTSKRRLRSLRTGYSDETQYPIRH